MWLEFEVSNQDNEAVCYGLGNAMVKKVEITIGGYRIDCHYGEWMNIWSELSIPESKRQGYDEMVGNYHKSKNIKNKLHVPLMFWFNRNLGLAIPLVALKYHEVKLNLELSSVEELDTRKNNPIKLESCRLWAEYIFLDQDEKRRFAEVNHEYLIDKFSDIGSNELLTVGDSNINLFARGRLVREIFWVKQNDNEVGRKNSNPCQFSSFGKNATFQLFFDGQNRFDKDRDEDYFTTIQPYYHHTHIPRANRIIGETGKGNLRQTHSQFINSYSFSLNPEEIQPSGAVNFDYIDSVNLKINNNDKPGILKTFCIRHDMLRIMSGMAGLAFSS